MEKSVDSVDAVIPIDVSMALRSGMAYVCAMCENFWEAQKFGSSECLALVRGKKCGGPMAGMTFPHYKGALTEVDSWSGFCFVCGDDSDAGVSVGGSGRLLGVCRMHIELVENLCAVGAVKRDVKQTSVELIGG